MTEAAFQCVILAAGKGTRMNSALPKVLHPLLERSMLDWVVDNALGAGAEQVVVVVGHGREEVERRLGLRRDHDVIRTALQAEQLGTGHAVWSAREALLASSAPLTLVLSGDVPNLAASTLAGFLSAAREAARPVALMTARLAEAARYGRIVRDAAGDLVAIVEARDASPEQLAIQEINAGIYLFDTSFLIRQLDALMARPVANAQGEYYLTDLVASAREEGGAMAWEVSDLRETLGVNNRAELAEAAAFARDRIAQRWMLAGVTLVDPAQTYIGPLVTLEPDVTLYPQVHLYGETHVGMGTTIEPGCVVRDAQLGACCQIKAHTTITEASVGDGAQVGPCAHLRPGAQLGAEVKVGNFVEIKKTQLERGAKVSHLTYLGDAFVGEDANVGAGTITCNYDGAKKHITRIGARAFIGSNSALVAPIQIGDGAYVGAGSTLTHDVPSRALGVARQRQRIIEGWADRTKKP